jgi:hypothetical protein
VIGYGTGDRGSISSRDRDNPPRQHVQTESRAQSASCPVGTGCSFPGVKRPKREADNSPESSSDVDLPPLPNTHSCRGA